MSRTVRNTKQQSTIVKYEDTRSVKDWYRGAEEIPKRRKELKEDVHKHNRRVARKQERDAKREF